MPVTARLSKRFYDQLGDEVANELVNWLNAVDDTYRSDLRALNEANFARFDASMRDRFALQDALIDKRFAEADARIEKRFAEADARIEKRFAEIDGRFAQLETKLEKRLSEHTRWMFAAWASLLIPIVGFGLRG